MHLKPKLTIYLFVYFLIRPIMLQDNNIGFKAHVNFKRAFYFTAIHGVLYIFNVTIKR